MYLKKKETLRDKIEQIGEGPKESFSKIHERFLIERDRKSAKYSKKPKKML